MRPPFSGAEPDPDLDLDLDLDCFNPDFTVFTVSGRTADKLCLGTKVKISVLTCNNQYQPNRWLSKEKDTGNNNTQRTDVSMNNAGSYFLLDETTESGFDLGATIDHKS